MSKHVTHSHCRVLHDVATLSIEELENEYSIEVDPDDLSVWDRFEGRTFPDIHHWAEYINLRDREEIEGVEFGGKVKTSRLRSSDDY